MGTSEVKTSTKTANISQTSYKDTDDKWLPVRTSTPLPVGGDVRLANEDGTIINPSTLEGRFWNEGYTRKIIDNSIEILPYRGAQISISGAIHAPMETMIKEDDLVKTLIFGSGDDSVMQIFRASSDNLHDIRLTLKGAGGITTIDNMEYATDAAAQAEWMASDAVNTGVISEGTIIQQGTYSLGIHCRKNQSPGDTVTKTIPSTDYSTAVIRFTRYNDVPHGKCIWKLRISDDGTDWLESQFTSVNANVWEELNIAVDTMSLVGADVDTTQITKIQLYMVSCTSPDHIFYIDQMELVSEAGTASVKIYDFGSNPTPTNLTDGIQLIFDEGATSIDFVSPISKNIVNFHVHYGAHQRDDKLTIGDYYGIVVGDLSGGTLEIYGTNTQTYNNGKMFTELNGVLTQTSKSMRFMCFSTAECILLDSIATFDADPGDSYIFITIKDFYNDERLYYHGGVVLLDGRTSVTISPNSVPGLPFYLNSDTPFRPIYTDDAATSAATKIRVESCYIYKPIITYG